MLIFRALNKISSWILMWKTLQVWANIISNQYTGILIWAKFPNDPYLSNIIMLWSSDVDPNPGDQDQSSYYLSKI